MPTDNLSMPDPCPHVTRIDVIRAKLHGDILPHCDQCHPILSNDPARLAEALRGTVHDVTQDILAGIEEMLYDRTSMRMSMAWLAELADRSPIHVAELRLQVDCHHISLLADLYQRWNALC